MSGPFDIVKSMHNAFRRDISQIDDSVSRIARSGGDLTPILDRLHIMNIVLDYHARGEEEVVFPAVDKVAPMGIKAYVMDHRELDNMVGGLEGMRKSPDSLTTARATAVMASHLRIHLAKEDAFLYPALIERTPAGEQASMVGLMSKNVPPDKFPIVVQWAYPLLDLDDRVALTRGWMTLMPPQIFAGLKPLIRKSVGEAWVELARRIPGLDDK